MKTKSNPVRRLIAPWLLAIACLSNVGCKDTLQLKEQRRQLQAETEALRTEFADLEAKLTDLRKAMPTASTPKAAAEAMAKVHQKEIAETTREKAALAERVKAEEQRIATLQKEIADFKALSQSPKPPTPPKS